MDQIDELLELLVTIDKAILTNVLTCLQDLEDKIEFLQLESQLQRDEIQQKNRHFELVLVQNNSLLEFENDSYQHPTHDQINDSTSEAYSNEDEVCHKQILHALSNPIIKPWEEIRHNNHKISIGYEKDFTFHNLY